MGNCFCFVDSVSFSGFPRQTAAPAAAGNYAADSGLYHQEMPK